MDKLIPGLVVALILVLLLALMWRAWRARARRDMAHGTPALPDGFAPTGQADVLYVATTASGSPLERLAIPGLAFRSRATVLVAADALAISLPGESAVHVPAAAIDSVGSARVAIDRVVEPGGLLRLGWRLPDGTPVDSYFRAQDDDEQRALTAAIDALLPSHTAATATESENNA